MGVSIKICTVRRCREPCESTAFCSGGISSRAAYTAHAPCRWTTATSPAARRASSPGNTPAAHSAMIPCAASRPSRRSSADAFPTKTLRWRNPKNDFSRSPAAYRRLFCPALMSFGPMPRRGAGRVHARYPGYRRLSRRPGDRLAALRKERRGEAVSSLDDQDHDRAHCP